MESHADSAVCSHCGSPIDHHAYKRRNREFCCEGCFLKEKEFRAVTEARDSAYLSLAEALSSALDLRERETGFHSKRVACHTIVLARRFTDDAEELRQIYWGALLHDIGKIGVPDSILLKNGPLTVGEAESMRKHPAMGHSILETASFMTPAAGIVLSHHERYDGSGYPRGLAGDDIPLGARLFAVIDTLDAVTSDRPYRKGAAFDEAKKLIAAQAGAQFAPEAVSAFMAEEETLHEMVAIKCQRTPLGIYQAHAARDPNK